MGDTIGGGGAPPVHGVTGVFIACLIILSVDPRREGKHSIFWSKGSKRYLLIMQMEKKGARVWTWEVACTRASYSRRNSRSGMCFVGTFLVYFVKLLEFVGVVNLYGDYRYY